ncbi:MAG TPA: hypothetical protein VKP30_15945, partial [Polyangiaceae bacterium]|nr:hypothetical protein [Polyangiaceae bacterium]
QLLRSSTLLDLELPQVARGTCSNHWGKTQVIPPTAEAEAEPSRPKLCTGSVTSGNTTPAPRSMQTPSMRTHSVGTPAPSPDGAIGAASRSAACKQQETGLRAQHDTPAPTTARSALLDFDKTLELRHATTPLAAQSEQLPSSLRFNSLDPGVTQVLPVEDLVARRNQVTNGGAPVGSRKDPTRVEVLQRRVSETVMGRWQKLPKLTRAAFALALFGALLWGANAECESHPQVPVVALATPVKPSAAVATEPSSGTERGSTATAHGSAPLPPVDPRSTMERTAVDATAEGRYGVAIRLYETLADAHPENPVYREAARILSARTQQRF